MKDWDEWTWLGVASVVLIVCVTIYSTADLFVEKCRCGDACPCHAEEAK